LLKLHLRIARDRDIGTMAQGTHSAQFGSLENPGQLRLLKVIDQLRELGVGEDISLPQVRPLPVLLEDVKHVT